VQAHNACMTVDVIALDQWHSRCLKMQSVIVKKPHNVLLLHCYQYLFILYYKIFHLNVRNNNDGV